MNPLTNKNYLRFRVGQNRISRFPLSRTFCLLMVLAGLVCWSSSVLSAAVIAEKGSSNYSIQLPKAASPVEIWAAEELQSYLKQLTGAELPILNESENSDSVHVLSVGKTEKALKRLDFSKFTGDEILVEALPDGTLLFAGAEPRGTIYAVYVFLEKVGGVRWWTRDFTHVPKLETLSVEENFKLSHSPKMIYREVYHRLAKEELFSVRNRLNGQHHRIDPSRGGHEKLVSWVHSFYSYLPPSKYFEEHPEWYSEINGERTAKNAQLCLTNEEMTQEFIQNVLKRLRENPNARIIDVSQNDNVRPCTCEKCRALDEAEGSQAATLFAFVNRVAEAVEKEFPNVLVETLAYQYTRKPPKTIKPRENVLVRLCSIECSFLKPLNDESNQEFADDLEGWRKISRQLFIWDYLTNYHDYVGPFPNLRAIGPNVKYLTDIGAIGLFAEAEGDDFCEMRNWVVAQLMWDPNQDPEALKKEFLEGFYGKETAPILQQYLDVLHDRAEEVDVYLGCFRAKTHKWLDLKTLNAAAKLRNQAFEVSLRTNGKDSPEFQHLRKTMLAIDSVWIYRWDSLAQTSELEGIPWEGPEDFRTAIHDFAARCEEFEIKNPTISQTNAMQTYLAGLEGNVTARQNLPDFCEGKDSNKILAFSAMGFENVHSAAKVIEDPEAQGGKAMQMGTKVDWNVQYYPGFKGKFRVYASLRCEGKEWEKKLGSFGIYDVQNKKSVRVRPLAPSDFLLPEGGYDPKYRWIELGVVELPESCYLWFAHAHSPELEAICLDRVIFLPEK